MPEGLWDSKRCACGLGCYYKDDSLFKRVLGLKRLPDTATLSRMLAGTYPNTLARLRGQVNRCPAALSSPRQC